MRHLIPAVLTASLGFPGVAAACGGFFCFDEPIDQSKERIIFAIDEDKGEVDVHIQIFYQGAAEEFAWIVPMPALPEVGLSTDVLFDRLAQRTNPRFNLEWTFSGDCGWNNDTFFNDDMDGAPPSAGGMPEADSGAGGVTVVAQTQVGPYDQATLQATSSELLLEWLNDNGYQLPDSLNSVLAPYIAGGSYFVALKLQNDKDVGDIAPVRMEYAASKAMIPLVLTSVAATPDMRLEPYVLSSARAVPENYLHVRINEAAINWFNGGQNYDDVITQAANEAGGQAFATDFAGSTSPFRDMLSTQGMNTADIRAAASPGEVMDALMWSGIPNNDTILTLLQTYLPMPEAARSAGIRDTDFYNCIPCYSQYTEGMTWDAGGFADAIEAEIIEPMDEANELFRRHSYITRLTSSMSPEEMTLDPFFVINPDMPDKSNQYRAEVEVHCDDGSSPWESRRTLTLNDGRQIHVPSDEWLGANGMSYDDFLELLGANAAMIIERTSASGLPEALVDASGDIDNAIDEHNRRYGPGGDLTGDAAEGCGCAAGGVAASGWFALAGLAAVRRRRR